MVIVVMQIWLQIMKAIENNQPETMTFCAAYGCVYDSLLIDPIFVDIHTCVRQYLAELYASMGDEKSAMALH